MRSIDTSAYSSTKPSRITPEEIDLGSLPPIGKSNSIAPPEPSVMSSPPPSVPVSQPENAETERNSERFSERTENRADNRTEIRTVLPIKRQTKRYSFEFYVDQLTRLKRLKHRVEEEGENISLSDIVRQAVDTYLKGQGE